MLFPLLSLSRFCERLERERLEEEQKIDLDLLFKQTEQYNNVTLLHCKYYMSYLCKNTDLSSAKSTKISQVKHILVLCIFCFLLDWTILLFYFNVAVICVGHFIYMISYTVAYFDLSQCITFYKLITGISEIDLKSLFCKVTIYLPSK